MLKRELKPYFDGRFSPDREAFGAEHRAEENKLEVFMRSMCMEKFATRKEYEAFEDAVFSLIGNMHIPAMEAAFEKGVECAFALMKEANS